MENKNNSQISMQGITKVFSTAEVETHAVSDINLSIAKGEYVSISGPSGSGKSTLLSILGLLDQPTSGSYIIEGQDVSRLTLKQAAAVRNQKLGFVFQQFNLIDELSVFDNIALPLRYAPVPVGVEDAHQLVQACLAKVDMSHRMHHKPNQLSGGQQQRIAIARSLVSNPAVLLVDEPTGNLDSKNGDMVMDMLQKLNDEGTTICMVTHDPRYADLAKRQLHLRDGKLLDEAMTSMQEAV
ncbi:ABC transporter ATP-binding protein [Thalassomonas sp. RHCl1]|uniref:ABC transporter ATP-binding protein n=1 Tax=Thalassomonas sp. RHCl1 TaxID=2995320 RepID=UPI00248B49C0|nr:ABC transporter ATP-binding protein [Thalassomonas sp. RHCl1]